MLDFGQRLRAERKARGLSQAELGAPSFSASYISFVESGKRPPTAGLVEHLAERLDIGVHDLLPPPPSNGLSPGIMKLLATMRRVRRAWELRDHAEAAEAAVEAISIAGGLNRPDVIWEMTLSRARAQIACRDYEGGARSIETLRTHPFMAQSASAAAEALTIQAVALRAHGSLERARDVAEEAEHVSHAAEVDAATRAAAMTALVAALAELGRLEEARPLVDRLRRILDDRSLRPHDIGTTAWALGNVAYLNGDTAEGGVLHDRAAECLEPGVDLRRWGRFHRAAAHVRLKAGIEEGVAEHLSQAHAALGVVGNESDLRELELTVAELHLHQGRLDEAGEVLDRHATELNDLERAEMHEFASRLWSARGDGRRASREAASAARAFERVGATRRALDMWSAFEQIVTGQDVGVGSG